MISILIVNNENSNDFAKEIYRYLREIYPVIYIAKREIYVPVSNAKILICDIVDFDKIAGNDTIIIFKSFSNSVHNFTSIVGKCKLAIVDASSNSAIQYASTMKIPAITCGWSSKDTITLSSVSEHHAVINIQRNIVDFKNRELESQEIPIQLSCKINNFTLMSICMIILLFGDKKKLTNIYI